MTLPDPRPRFRRILCAFGFLLLFAVPAVASPERNWATYLGGSGDDRLNDVTLAPDGDLLVCGYTTSTALNGITATLIGSDDPNRLSMHGGFIAKISPDGQTIRWIRRFGKGVVFLTDVQTDGTYVYVTGVATSVGQADLIAPYNGYDKNPPTTVQSEYQGFISTHNAPDTYRSILIQLNADASAIVNASWMGEPTPGRESYGIGDLIGSWYVNSDMWRYAKQRENWDFARMNPYTINRIELLENGDLILMIDPGLRWAGGQDNLYRFSAGDISAGGLIWKKVFDAAGNNSTVSSPEHASVLSADMAITSDEQYIYVTGGSNGYTGFEPYWNPYIFKFDTATGTQLWERTGVSRGGPYGTYNIIQTQVRPRISDSFGQAITLNSDDEPLVSMWTDGGESFLVQEHPWTLSGTPNNQDGDGFFGFKARTFAPVLGRYSPDGVSGWLRSHRIKPNPNTNPDQNATMFLDVAAVDRRPDEMVAVGWTFGMPQVDPWETGTGIGTIARLELADGGTTREFVSRVPNIDEFLSVIARPNERTFTAVGYAASGAPTLNAIQATHAGGNHDAYLITFTDDFLIADGVWAEKIPTGMRVHFDSTRAGDIVLEESSDLGTTDPWSSVPGQTATATGADESFDMDVGTPDEANYFRVMPE